MERKRIVGVLTPRMHGFYYGALLRSIHQVLSGFQVRMLSIQTRSESGPQNETYYEDRLALEHVDGWISLYDSASGVLLETIHKSGKPLVTVGHELPEFYGFPSVKADQESGIFSVIRHLVEHGHRKIAFCGNFNVRDHAERYQGYCKALQANGIEFDPQLVFTEDMKPKTVSLLADRYARKEFQCTAILFATDAFAAAFMTRAQARGVKVPEDIAVAGYDDYDNLYSLYPALTTVHNPVHSLGEAAAELMLRWMGISGNSTEPRRSQRIPTQMVVRQSCGCRLEKSNNLQDYHRIIGVSELRNRFYEEAITKNFWACRDLINFNKNHFRQMMWLNHMDVFRGCFGQWEEMGPAKILRTGLLYETGESTTPWTEQPILPEAFPPLELFQGDDAFWQKNMLQLIPVRTMKQKWGVLALVKPIENMEIEDTNHLVIMFATALEREELLRNVQESEQDHRLLAETLDKVLQTTTDGIWDWDLRSENVHFNDRCRKILRSDRDVYPISGILTELGLEATEDIEKFGRSLKEHLAGEAPVQMEFHTFHHQMERWFYLTAQGIWGEDGTPVRIIGSISDITGRKRSEEQIRFLAYHDALTGLPNRTLFNELLQAAIQQAGRTGKKIGVMLLDLDRFKLLNDTYGHPAGDKLLQFVAQQIQKPLPKKASVARLGGDEFIFLIPEIESEEEIRHIASSTLKVLDTPFIDGTLEFTITASIGISLYPDHGHNSNEIMMSADVAMYRSKSEGKNRATLYTKSMNEAAANDLDMEKGLRRALGRNEFVLHYQPQFESSSGKLYGAEALIRWHSPDRGIVSPQDFIPLAEETGLIVPIGEWVLREACAQNKRWQAQGYPAMRVCVNISARQFMQPNFLSSIREALQETELEPRYLCLEITESTAILNIDYSKEMLRELMDLGVCVSMDDFGTGYSSLALLKRLQLNEIKIDRSFIRDIHADTGDAAIVEAVIHMSHRLGIGIVAEGVETGQQMDLLEQQGCDVIQGYWFSQPLPPEQLETNFLAEKISF